MNRKLQGRGDLALALYGIEPGLEATSFYEPSNCLFPFGTHVAVVEVDPETGEVKFRLWRAFRKFIREKLAGLFGRKDREV